MATAQDKVFVLFTMDVEPPTAQAGHSGPRSDEEGEQAVLDYERVLAAHGYPATYFIHPEVARNQAALFQGLCARRNGLGLHLHTTKFRDAPRSVELGGLTDDDQRAVLRQAAAVYERSLGFRPTLFRPGCFSANDATYRILTELGFQGGSVSIPGRIWTERYCVWSGAYPYVHWAHATFRQVQGQLPFVEIPLSVDLTGALRRHPQGFYHYPDLRPGGVYADDEHVERDHARLLRNILRRMARDNPPVKTIVIDVHNDRDLVGSSLAAQHLRLLLDRLEPEIRQLGWQPVAATFERVVAQAKEAQTAGFREAL